jgi:hypothetical protein
MLKDEAEVQGCGTTACLRQMKVQTCYDIMISSSELSSGWAANDRLMYTLPMELIKNLDELVAGRLQPM